MMQMSSSLKARSPRVPPARPVARDDPAVEVKGAAGGDGVTRSEGNPLLLPPTLIFIVRVE